ncbi:hypothetical protein ACLOJK_010989 [Asimina triloba]
MGTCDWTRGRVIGRGSSATVSVATHHRSGKIFAVKSAELAFSEHLRQEQRILSQLDCPRVVGYLGQDVTFENGRRLYNLLMDYADRGTLTDVIHKRGGRLEEDAIQSFSREILQGLAYIHSKGLVHCDIKGRNVLVGSDDGVRIGDLGCAKRAGESPRIAGTPLYMAPEVARGEEQSYAADVWAFGCTVIEMATGRPPWPEVTDPVTALHRIGHSNDVPESPSWLSEPAKDFLSGCLRRRPEERWTVYELLQHPFVVDGLNSAPKQVSDAPITNSPKSILDNAMWESIGEDQTDEDPTTPNHTSDNSPSERMQRLSGGDSSSSIPDWTCEGDWMTIRESEQVENTWELVGQITVEEIGGPDSVGENEEEQAFDTRPLIKEGAPSSSSMSENCLDHSSGSCLHRMTLASYGRGYTPPVQACGVPSTQS